RAEARAVPDRPVRELKAGGGFMTDTTIDPTGELQEVAETERPSPTEVGAAAETAPVSVRRARRSANGLIQTVGRRKEAVVRVRLVPGTGQIVCNGRPLENYFPNKLHQQ